MCILTWKTPKKLFRPKKHTQSDKIGRLKHNQQLLKQTLSEVEEVKLMLQTIFAGLKAAFNFERSVIERVACVDEVDRRILQCLFEAGSNGLLPQNLAVNFKHFKVTRHQVLKICDCKLATTSLLALSVKITPLMGNERLIIED